LPDLSDCREATGPTADWRALVAHGGSFLGMSPEMPAFPELGDDEIAAVVSWIQGLCPDPRYPPADLDFHDPVFGQNAFPEDEVIVTTTFAAARRESDTMLDTVVQKRVGPHGQVGVDVPVEVMDPRGRAPIAGIGDVRASYKHAVLVAPELNSLASLGADIATPTGNARNGVGQGTFVGTVALLSGHAVGPLVIQTDTRAELPADPARAPRRMRYRLAFQYPLGPYAKDPVPALELEQRQSLDRRVHAATLLGPTTIVALSRRGHVALGFGAQLPVAGRRPFDWRVGAELYWQYTEGAPWAW
jgi:hypothetical protein